MCIRDRYQRRVHGDLIKYKDFTTTVMRAALALFALSIVALVASTSIEFPHYNKCDPRWVAKLYRDPSVCGKVKTEENFMASATTFLADLLTWKSIPCNGINPCTPPAVAGDPVLTDLKLLENTYGIKVAGPEKQIPLLAKAVQDGKLASVFKQPSLYFLAHSYSEKGFHVVCPQGNVLTIPPEKVMYGYIIEFNPPQNNNFLDEQIVLVRFVFLCAKRRVSFSQ
eukprot:TRINITY_DN5194_c0_g1_i1.p1 TRINITY_DN5194_c0_g1~~TRINITY_DN5194_c0_g1_i1.p1  ORF type:complete len:225 (+),score=51.38 TRINITY_DN5194_c0_g1_i1:92-766(+)